MRGLTLTKVWTLCRSLGVTNQALALKQLNFSSVLRLTHTMSSSMCTLSQPKPLVGVVQMTSVPDKDANFEQGCSLIKKAVSRGAQVSKIRLYAFIMKY